MELTFKINWCAQIEDKDTQKKTEFYYLSTFKYILTKEHSYVHVITWPKIKQLTSIETYTHYCHALFLFTLYFIRFSATKPVWNAQRKLCLIVLEGSRLE